MKILVSNDVIIDAGDNYTAYDNFVLAHRGIRYVTLNNLNSSVYEVDDFEYNQTFDGGRFSYIEGIITEMYPSQIDFDLESENEDLNL